MWTPKWARSRRIRPLIALGLLAGVPVVGAWAWLSFGGTGLTASIEGGGRFRGRILLGIQTSPTHVSSPGKVTPASGGVWSIDPATGSNRKILDGLSQSGRASPDGRSIVYEDDLQRWWLAPTDGSAEPTPAPVGRGIPPLWSADGRSILINDMSPEMDNVPKRAGSVRLLVPSMREERLQGPIARGDLILAASRDGRWLLVTSPGSVRLVATVGDESRLLIGPPAGGTPNPVYGPFRFSPDSRRIAFLRREGKSKVDLCEMDLSGGSIRVIRPDIGPDARELSCSPDGRAFLITWHSTAAVVGADGSMTPIRLAVRKPVDLDDPRTMFDPKPLYIGTAEWIDAP